MAFYVCGLSFSRNNDGSVTISKEDSEIVGRSIKIATIDADGWCSTIAAVSKGADTAESFNRAKLFHVGEEALEDVLLNKAKLALMDMKDWWNKSKEEIEKEWYKKLHEKYGKK